MQSFLFRCSKCGSRQAVPDGRYGADVVCGECGRETTLPAASVEFICTGCGAEFRAAQELRGTFFLCSECETRLAVPWSTTDRKEWMAPKSWIGDRPDPANGGAGGGGPGSAPDVGAVAPVPELPPPPPPVFETRMASRKGVLAAAAGAGVVLVLLVAVLWMGGTGNQPATAGRPAAPETAPIPSAEPMPTGETTDTEIPTPEAVVALVEDENEGGTASEDEAFAEFAALSESGEEDPPDVDLMSGGWETLGRRSYGDRERRELIEHAMATFSLGRDREGEDEALSKLADAVAGFHLHHPTVAECDQMTELCEELAGMEYTEEVKQAIEGSRLLFEEEAEMLAAGYRRYGRRWVDPEAYAELRRRWAAHAKETERLRAESVRSDTSAGTGTPAVRRRAPVSRPQFRSTDKRPVKRIGEGG